MILMALMLMAIGGEPNDTRRLEQHYAERDLDAGPLQEFRGGGSSDSSGIDAAATLALLLGTAVVVLAIWGITVLVKAAAS